MQQIVGKLLVFRKQDGKKTWTAALAFGLPREPNIGKEALISSLGLTFPLRCPMEEIDSATGLYSHRKIQPFGSLKPLGN